MAYGFWGFFILKCKKFSSQFARRINRIKSLSGKTLFPISFFCDLSMPPVAARLFTLQNKKSPKAKNLKKAIDKYTNCDIFIEKAMKRRVSS